MKLKIIVESGINADKFETVVRNNDNVVVYQKTWYCGYDYSHSREWSSSDKPYPTDALQGLIDKYNIKEFSVESGRNVFTGNDVDSDTVADFKNEYCMDLKLCN